MKKLFIFLPLFILITDYAASAPWWEQDTVCKINNEKCYPNMGIGFDTEIWDADANCRGMKYICPEALIPKENTPKLVSKQDLANKKNINPDYNTDILSEYGDCFGHRNINKSGSQVMVSGKYINVWCNGVLDRSDETLANGEITYDTQPNCKTLQKNSYIAVENGNCFGKYIDSSEYYIDCGNSDEKPERLVKLNDAQYGKHTHKGPLTKADANDIFDTMKSVSKTQKKQYFKK